MWRLALVCIMVLALSASCGKRTKKLDRSMRRTIDTTAARQKVILREELDSLCKMHFDSLVQNAVDSILEERRAEIDMIIRKKNNDAN